jgi:hypothetical protein
MAGTPYVDVEELVVTWMKSRDGYVNVVTEVPANLQFAMPLWVVERFGGSDSVLTIDVANVDIDVYAADRPSAKALAEALRQDIRIHLTGYRPVASPQTVVAKVETISAPIHAPYDSKARVRRFTAAYRIYLHQHAGV